MTQTNLTNLDVQQKLLLQTIVMQLNLSQQTLHNSAQLLMNPKISHFIANTTKQQANQAVIAVTFLSHKLHQKNRLSFDKFAEFYEQNRIGNSIQDMEMIITKMVRWKMSNPLLLNQVYQIAQKWDSFTKHVSLIDVHFIDPCCPINLRILSENILKLVYHKDTYDYSFQKIGISLIYLTIKNSVANLTKNMKFQPTVSIDFVFDDFLRQKFRESIESCSRQIKWVKKLVFHWMDFEAKKQNFNNFQRLKTTKLSQKPHKLK